ncbi:hypothetical protein [Bacillus pseudomycoides]|uniref:Uncharacterized protein n=1 Tax=Bacillus pseudomycoides TaxID=64104 RepID=A0AAJ2DQK3_9BACI|nr:hypothetical protein [Bacillus pseudomycoides]EEM07955.1 hypothetical protein bmyco0003_53480 [Bacillus pseudomycoides]MCR8860919.1 hypothetical protein [Bacillus pseudomycoides]MDR4329638.1 hypothetical protein [Bacillus pseudomycoides]MED1537771.1 hypothetical protein [Bacillus pseudomycoides]PEP57335.1 hypothetical protein CN564_14250 [Bacillus pseudomycoides]
MNIRWYEDGMSFETLREAQEWACSVVYNEIGNLYDGYKTTDEKIAYALVYELVRANTLYNPSFKIHTDWDYIAPQSFIYKIWVEN